MSVTKIIPVTNCTRVVLRQLDWFWHLSRWQNQSSCLNATLVTQSNLWAKRWINLSFKKTNKNQ